MKIFGWKSTTPTSDDWCNFSAASGDHEIVGPGPSGSLGPAPDGKPRGTHPKPSLVKDVFVTTKIQPTLPQITIPPSIGTPENVTTTIVDTSALPYERAELNKEIRKSNVILLVYSDHYSYERVALFWMPHFRSLAVNVPVVLCANKSDLTRNTSTDQIVEDEMLPVMAEFKEIDSCIRTSAREHHNINEVFFLCQKAVTDPIAPLFDSKESALKPACVSALQRIFYLCDRDQDEYLSDEEILDFQSKCFGKPLSDLDLSAIKSSIQKYSADYVTEKGISQPGFIQLNKLFAEKGRHETIWLILRTFRYTDSLSLQSSFLFPKFEVPANSSAELSPAGYRFFVDLFLLHDKDNDGGLSPSELTTLFAPSPGLPPQWLENGFPSCTVRNDAGYVTLQGWLAQWSMTTFLSPKTTLAYLAYFGFDSSLPSTSSPHPTTSALTITKPRKRPPRTTAGRRRLPPISRTVLQAFILGAPHSGKSTLLHTFLSRPPTNTSSTAYSPTLTPSTAVNTVELPGGKQVTLLLSELASHESAILSNPSALSKCDILLYLYDSSDPHSFAHIPRLREQYGKHLDDACPAMFVATKADRDRVMQDWEVQPEEYCAGLGVGKPSHVSVEWGSVQELFVRVAEVGLDPGSAFVKGEGEAEDEEGWMGWWVAVGAIGVVAAAALGMWRRMSG
ncbi:MAG: hypothetical protein LQ338_002956 [Usnochroma carphineum]|nr:MAG: hypothetical protein LQ338_002956 [Usnochroma carphineum]